MANFLFKLLIITACIASSLSSRAQAGKSIVKNKLVLDSTKTVIIPFDPLYWVFDTSYRAATLTQKDLSIIDSLIPLSIKGKGIDLRKGKYRKQLMVAINKNGEKVVWINFFCRFYDEKNWKTKPVFVADGGRCFFNFKINLLSKKFYEFMVNGEA